MANTQLGKVCVTPKGAYDANAMYEKLDIVRHNGALYIVKHDCKGITPVDGDDYMLLISDGGSSLLDNSNFIINQTGDGVYSGDDIDTVDRWKTIREMQVEILPDGSISLTRISDAGTAYFSQSIERERLTIGESYTIAAHVDNTIICGSFTLTGEEANTLMLYNSDDHALIFYSGTAGVYSIRLGVKKQNTASIVRWVDMYKGSYTAETLPPRVLKRYASELLECQRYYVPLPGFACIGHVTSSAKNYHMYVQLPVNMRAVPSIAEDFTVIMRLASGDGYSALTPNANEYTVTASEVSVIHGDDQSIVHLIFKIPDAVDPNNTVIEYCVTGLKFSAAL